MSPPDDVGSPAPIDRPILEYLRTRLQTTSQFARVRLTDADGHLELRAVLADDYYPDHVAEAVCFVRWYVNDDFKIHYRERHADGSWECRWDRHRNPHNSRDHFHPPPDASTPAVDRSWPTDYRETIRIVLDDVRERIEELWSE